MNSNVKFRKEQVLVEILMIRCSHIYLVQAHLLTRKPRPEICPFLARYVANNFPIGESSRLTWKVAIKDLTAPSADCSSITRTC